MKLIFFFQHIIFFSRLFQLNIYLQQNLLYQLKIYYNQNKYIQQNISKHKRVTLSLETEKILIAALNSIKLKKKIIIN